MAAFGRNGPVVSESCAFERKLVRWRRLGMWDESWDLLTPKQRMVKVQFIDPMPRSASKRWRLDPSMT